MATRNQYSKWHSVKVKARFNYQCAKCGSTENIQAHDPTGTHHNWRDGIALCGHCHSLEHPNVPATLFESSSHQPYWSNISASTLAKEFKCHNRTIIRVARRLGIPPKQPLSEEQKALLKDNIIGKELLTMPIDSQPSMTVREVADYLHLSEYTITEYLRSGQLKGFKIHTGGPHRWRVKRQDLLYFINKHSNI